MALVNSLPGAISTTVNEDWKNNPIYENVFKTPTVTTSKPTLVTSPITYTPAQTVSTASNTVSNPYAELLKLQQEQLAARKAQANAQYNSRVNNINSGSDEILRQAYIQKMQNERTMPQQLKAIGIAGGASETVKQNMDINYQNNRQDTEIEKLKAIDEAASDRDAMITQYYDDFLTSKSGLLQNDYENKIAAANTGTAATTPASQSGGVTTISDGGKSFATLAQWVNYKQSQGMSEDEIRNLAISSGLV